MSENGMNNFELFKIRVEYKKQKQSKWIENMYTKTNEFVELTGSMVKNINNFIENILFIKRKIVWKQKQITKRKQEQ